MNGVVLDASAVLAFILREPGGDLVEATLGISAISAVNLAEAASKMVDRGATPDAAMAIVRALPSRVEPLDKELALQIGALRACTAHLGLSLGDRACLALGRRLGLPVLTCDRPWASLGLDLEIRLVR